MNRNLGAVLGSAQRGHVLGWRAVLGGMKFLGADPGFLQGRDQTLRALGLATTRFAPTRRAALLRAAAGAFEQFGMAAGARSNGPALAGIVAAF